MGRAVQKTMDAEMDATERLKEILETRPIPAVAATCR